MSRRATYLALALSLAMLFGNTIFHGLAGAMFTFASSVSLPFCAGWLWYWLRGANVYDSWTVSAVVGIPVGIIGHQIAWAFGAAVSLAIVLIVRWWRRRGRRAAQALGNKARAIRAKLTRTLRERVIPLPQRA